MAVMTNDTASGISKRWALAIFVVVGSALAVGNLSA